MNGPSGTGRPQKTPKEMKPPNDCPGAVCA